MISTCQKYTLKFKFDAGTSRGILKQHQAYYVKLYDEGDSNVIGIGEASPLQRLSIDDLPDFEQIMRSEVGQSASTSSEISTGYPSLRFAMETARRDLYQGGIKKIFDSDFYNKQKPIPINGLVWMGPKEEMKKAVLEKIRQGYRTIKLKIGALDFATECDLLKEIRKEYSSADIEIRVDANGAFKKENALENLSKLSEYGLHSIEQPIKQGQWEDMALLCEKSPLAIALDEELIGITDSAAQISLLDVIKPAYIIIKPTLLGGFDASDRWIKLAEQKNIGWWITSALESNIGLNAIAQFTSTYDPIIPQGLGTGSLYHNNIESPLVVKDGFLWYDKSLKWQDI